MPRTPPASMACEATTLLTHTVTKKAPMVSQSRFHQTDSASLLLYVFSFMGLPIRNGYGGSRVPALKQGRTGPFRPSRRAPQKSTTASAGTRGPETVTVPVRPGMILEQAHQHAQGHDDEEDGKAFLSLAVGREWESLAPMGPS